MIPRFIKIDKARFSAAVWSRSKSKVDAIERS